MMPDHRDRYRTMLGSFLTIITFILVLGYGSYKITDLTDYKDFTLFRFEKENYYDFRDALSSKEGLMIAAGITSFTDDQNAIEDPSIGTIKLITKSWDIESIGSKGALKFTEIPTRPCTQEDFAEDSSLFYKLKESSKEELDINWRKLKCIDKDTELMMFGNYRSQAANNIMVVFEKCDATVPGATCKSETDIKKWLEFKYIITVDNIKRFI